MSIKLTQRFHVVSEETVMWQYKSQKGRTNKETNGKITIKCLISISSEDSSVAWSQRTHSFDISAKIYSIYNIVYILHHSPPIAHFMRHIKIL